MTPEQARAPAKVSANACQSAWHFASRGCQTSALEVTHLQLVYMMSIWAPAANCTSQGGRGPAAGVPAKIAPLHLRQIRWTLCCLLRRHTLVDVGWAPRDLLPQASMASCDFQPIRYLSCHLSKTVTYLDHTKLVRLKVHSYPAILCPPLLLYTCVHPAHLMEIYCAAQHLSYVQQAAGWVRFVTLWSYRTTAMKQ